MDSDAQWQVVNGTVTDKRLYLRLKSAVITGEGAAVGDIMALGIGMSNSEVGCGSVNVYQMFWTLACLNGMQTEKRTRKSHITGARGDADTWGLLTDEAKDADNHALALQMRDVTRAYASREAFDEVLEKMKAAHADKVEGSPQSAVEAMGKVLALTKKDTASLMDGLLATIGQARRLPIVLDEAEVRRRAKLGQRPVRGGHPRRSRQALKEALILLGTSGT